MTGLESILAQITGDAAQEAEKLLAQGRQEAAASLDAAKAEAAKQAQELLDPRAARALARSSKRRWRRGFPPWRRPRRRITSPLCWGWPPAMPSRARRRCASPPGTSGGCPPTSPPG